MRKYYIDENNKLRSNPILEDHQIDREVVKRIRSHVSVDDELKARRVGGTFADEVDAHIADCVRWGQDAKAAAVAEREEYFIQLDVDAEEKLLALTKSDLVAYAETIGFDTSGTKQDIADRMLVAAGVKEAE